MSIDPGQMTETVTLENPAEVSQTDWGAPEGDQYKKTGTRRAKIEEDAGSRDRRAGRDEPRQGITITMRTWDKVTTESRFRWDDRLWWVEGVKITGRRDRFMQAEAFLDPDG